MPMHAPDRLGDYLDIHAADTILVCGCGASLKELPNSYRGVTIGINDAAVRQDPNYLVVLDPQSQFKSGGVKIVNLSPVSRVTAFPHRLLSEFLASAGKPNASPKSPQRRIFFMNYRFKTCGDVFSRGLSHGASELGLRHVSADYDDTELPYGYDSHLFLFDGGDVYWGTNDDGLGAWTIMPASS